MYPTFEEIEALHRKYAPNEQLFELVFAHCKIVLEIADHLLQRKQHNLNYDLVKTGALAHDIGAYTFFALEKEEGEKLYYKHAFEGANILRKENYPDEVCNLVEHHLGVGLPKEEIIERKLELPVKDFLPLTIEERLVLYADKFHSKTPKFNTYVSYMQFTAQFGEEAQKRFKALSEEFGVPDLEVFAQKYHHPIM